MLLRFIAVAVLAPLVAACSSDSVSFNVLPKIGSFELAPGRERAR